MIMTGSHSYIAKYTVYDTKSHIGVPLVMPDSSEYLQHAGWAPNANQLIVIHKNNIYFYFRIGDQPIQITTNGFCNPLTIAYTSCPVEHILKTHLTYWWLNDGSRLCYASFDNTLVDQMPYIIYGATNASSQSRPLAVGGGGDNDYPKVYTYPYPKPGREISKVTLTVVDISAPNYVRARTQVIPPDEIRGWDHYITAPVVWITKTSIAVVWSRRSQNYTVVSICKEETNWVCNKLIEEQLSGPKGWLMVDEGPVFSDDKKYMFMRLPVADGTFGTYDHIAMIYTESGKKYFLTHGQFVVTKIFAYRSDLHTL
ncbi:unnamed protein product [Oppiella nova]|uniref:Dipeptidylpeptidase IV N-terminal domain-containing protein n=1 Tax=Oppiella nova TaxID=334625 RepID=A0A7R9LUZ8_9ACAR|nr:unnamed protein product [Oppiella nova]CAG2167256.1 unnamed protein product [Oppiella nova]